MAVPRESPPQPEWVPDGWLESWPPPGRSLGQTRRWCGRWSRLRVAGAVQFGQSMLWVIGCGVLLTASYAYSREGDFAGQPGEGSAWVAMAVLGLLAAVGAMTLAAGMLDGSNGCRLASIPLQAASALVCLLVAAQGRPAIGLPALACSVGVLVLLCWSGSGRLRRWDGN